LNSELTLLKSGNNWKLQSPYYDKTSFNLAYRAWN